MKDEEIQNVLVRNICYLLEDKSEILMKNIFLLEEEVPITDKVFYIVKI